MSNLIEKKKFKAPTEITGQIIRLMTDVALTKYKHRKLRGCSIIAVSIISKFVDEDVVKSPSVVVMKIRNEGHDDALVW